MRPPSIAEPIALTYVFRIAVGLVLVALLHQEADARRGFNKAANPPKLTTQFKAANRQTHPSHTQRAPRRNYVIGQRNSLRSTFRAHASDRPHKQTLARSNRTVLGSYPRYVQKASVTGARYYSVPTKIWNKMNGAQKWRANRRFLDRMILRGDKVHLSNNGHKAPRGKDFAREIAYLRSNGYRLSKDGMRMIPPKTGPSRRVAAGVSGRSSTRSKALREHFRNEVAKR